MMERRLRWRYHCTALHCTALHCTVLYCTVLYCTALHCTTLYCTALRCSPLCKEPGGGISPGLPRLLSSPRPVASRHHCTALHCTALHCTALHCTALHCTVVLPPAGGLAPSSSSSRGAICCSLPLGQDSQYIQAGRTRRTPWGGPSPWTP
jgi:hypothetical protein